MAQSRAENELLVMQMVATAEYAVTAGQLSRELGHTIDKWRTIMKDLYDRGYLERARVERGGRGPDPYGYEIADR